jgi:hypothetical protein
MGNNWKLIALQVTLVLLGHKRNIIV